MTVTEVILITGASSGIGAATARLFAENGYRVILASRSQEKIDQLAGEINQAGGVAKPICTDVTRIVSVENLISKSIDAFGQIDILLNNAGIGHMDWLERLDPSVGIEDQIQTNLLGVIQTTRMVLPHMIARKKGHIINMGSLSGLIGTPTYSVYAASKFGLRGFSEALRRELRIWGIHVTVVYPGGVKNEFAARAGIRRRTGLSTPAWLKLSSEDVARTLLRVVNHPRRMVVIPRVMLALVVLNALLPGLLDWVIEKRFVESERGHE
jgi:short-subunit dehydrogenase